MLPSVPVGDMSPCDGFYVYSERNRVGLECLKVGWVALCDYPMMKTQRKTEIGKVHIASLECFIMQVSRRILGRVG